MFEKTRKIIAGDLFTILTRVVTWRLALLVIMALGSAVLPYNIVHERAHLGGNWLGPTAQWDANYYLDIAKYGYLYAVKYGSVAFFPYFSFAIRALEHLGIGELPAAFLINFFSTLGSAYFLFGLAREYVGTEGGRRAVTAFLVFPTALFLAAAYSEALFCFSVFGAFYFYQRKQPLPTAVLALIASGTRSYGILVGVSLTLGHLVRKEWARAALTALISSLSLVSYMVLLKHVVGDPLAFWHVESTYWSRHSDFNVIRVIYYWFLNYKGVTVDHVIFTTFEVGAWFLALFTTVISIRKLPWIWSFFTLSCLFIFLLAGHTSASIDRYVLPLFPMYITIARFQEEQFKNWALFSALLMGALALLFSACYWVD